MKILCSLLLMLLFASCNLVDRKQVEIKNGLLDLSEYTSEKEGIVKLTGNVHYYPERFIDQQDVAQGSYTFIQIPITGSTRNYFPSKTAIGFGTYHFVIKCRTTESRLGLYIHGIYSAYRIYCNGFLVDKLGVLSTSENTETPMVRPEIVALQLEEGNNDICIQISNHHEPNTQLGFSIELGDVQKLHEQKHWANGYDISFSFFYFILFVVFLILFLIELKIEIFTFSIYCFVLSLRFLIKNSKVLLELLDAGWVFFFKTEWFTYFLTSSFIMVMVFQFLKFKNQLQLNSWVVYLALFVGLITYVSPIQIFMKYSSFYHYYAIGLCMLSMGLAFRYVFLSGRDHIGYLILLSVMIYAGCYLYDILMSFVFYKESYFYNWGITGFSLIYGFVLVYQFYFAPATRKNNKHFH